MNFSVSAIRASIAQEDYLASPTSWVQERLGDHLWSKQARIINSVRDHRRTAVHSCHGAGKSFIASRIIAWWIENHPPGTARVLTSAHTGSQVKTVLWTEINRAHSKGRLSGRTNQTEWWLPIPGTDKEEIVALGRKPRDKDPGAFQGIHERYVLVVFDEAGWMNKGLWDAADTLIANEESRMLVIGNPDDPSSEFANVCKPGSGWNVIGISAYDTPNFTSESVPDKIRHGLIGPTWVEEKRQKWTESNPMFISKVLGRFPTISTDGLIPMQWVKGAQDRDLSRDAADGPIELGVDVGGGGDANVRALRRGPVVRVISKDHNPDTMQSLANLIEAIKTTGATTSKVDYIGIGKGMCDRAREISNDQSKPSKVRNVAGTIIGINVGEPANDKEEFVNLRAEGFWSIRERFERGDIDIDPDDDDLAAQLVDIRYKRQGGRIQIESKEDMRRRGKSSPNEADAVMLSFIKKLAGRSGGVLF